jgi:hypothetical protein
MPLSSEQKEQAAKALSGWMPILASRNFGWLLEAVNDLQSELAKVGLAIMPSISVERLLSACKTAVECCEREPSRQEYEHMFIELKTAIAESPVIQPIEKEEK